MSHSTSTTGGCLCGKVRYLFQGEPASVVICHCVPCHRTSNSTYSTSLIVPSPSFTLTSDTDRSTFARPGGESGLPVTYHFCAACGVLVYVLLDSMPGVTLVKSGSLDDLTLNEKWKPNVELYRKSKSAWVPDFEGTQKFDGGLTA